MSVVRLESPAVPFLVFLFAASACAQSIYTVRSTAPLTVIAEGAAGLHPLRLSLPPPTRFEMAVMQETSDTVSGTRTGQEEMKA